MRKLTFKWILSLISITHLVFCAKLRSSRPHIIYILADDLGWNDVSFHGSPEIPTPNIDSLAFKGIILNNYYVAPICTPSRSSLMTGKYDIHTGMQHDVIYGSQPYGLPLSEKLLPQYLKELGYDTHIVGKWHLGFFKSQYTPTHRGFDTHFGYYCGHQDYYDHTAHESEHDWGFDMRNGSQIAKETHGIYSTSLFTDEAVRLIKNHNRSTPLFLYLAHLAVHAGNPYAPLQAPLEYINRFPHIHDERRKTLAGMMAGLDDSVRDVVRALHQNSMLENSIIVFSTDNGGPTHGMNSNVASNWPLKGSKYTLWEGGIRGSAFIWSPNLRSSCRVSDQLMHISDWLPTLYSAAGGDAKTLPTYLDGMDMWKTLNFNHPSPRNEILHNIDDILKIAALRVGDYKVVIGHTFNGSFDDWFPPLAISDDCNFKLSAQLIDTESSIDYILNRFSSAKICEKNDDPRILCGPVPTNATKECQPQITPCLFNIRNDPCEFHNIAETHPEILRELMIRLEEYNATAIPPANQPDDPNGTPRLNGYNWIPWQDGTE